MQPRRGRTRRIKPNFELVLRRLNRGGREGGERFDRDDQKKFDTDKR